MGFIDVAIDKRAGVLLPFFYFFYVIEGKVDFVINKVNTIAVKSGHGLLLKPNVNMGFDFDEMIEGSANINIVRIPSEVISKFNYLSYISNGFNIKEVNRSGFKKRDYCLFDFCGYTESEKDVLRSLTVSIEHVNSSLNKKMGSCDEDILLYEYSLLLGILRLNNIEVEALFHEVTSESISERAARLVMSNYGKTWNVKTLSAELHMSESTFKKKMYKEVGGVNEFINELKIVESLRRLRRTNDSLTQISSDLGYCSSSYFTQVFTKHMRILPSKIREYFNSTANNRED
ncbi:AraC family transcriptional regulator [Citrobacter amalonaticus]|uniref:AraC family transcriptional regulator n=1 Tax=Citrobacter amalonaticus TaxID=35703 RepID=UPI00339BD94B